jgi:hypothetical protein
MSEENISEENTSPEGEEKQKKIKIQNCAGT